MISNQQFGRCKLLSLFNTTRFHPAMPGDTKDFFRKIIIQALPRFFFLFVESNQDNLVTRRLR